MTEMTQVITEMSQVMMEMNYGNERYQRASVPKRPRRLAPKRRRSAGKKTWFNDRR